MEAVCVMIAHADCKNLPQRNNISMLEQKALTGGEAC